MREEYWKDMAVQLAEGDHEQQAIFFNEFGRWLFMACKGMDAIHGMPMQCSHMADLLNDSAERVLREMVGFLDLKKEEEES